MFEFSESQVERVKNAIATALGDRDIEILDLFSEGLDLLGTISSNGYQQPFRLETRLKLNADSNEFAENKGTAVSDRAILEQIRSDLEARLVRVDRVYSVSVDDNDIFYGKAQKKLNATRSEIFSFKIDPEAGRITYKMDNADELLKYRETDEAWAETYEFAAKTGRAAMKLKCKPGNMQCGGKCQNGNRPCPSQMSEAERKAYRAAARKARGASKKEQDKPPTPPAKEVDPVGRSNKPLTKRQQEFTEIPTEEQLDAATKRWQQERGFISNTDGDWHDRQHQLMHGLLGMNGQEIQRDLGINGGDPGIMEEALVFYYQQHVDNANFKVSPRDYLEVGQSVFYGLKGVAELNGRPDEIALFRSDRWQDRFVQYADQMLNHPLFNDSTAEMRRQKQR